LSVTAILSLLASVVVAAAGVRSVRTYDAWGSNNWTIGIENGSIGFMRETGYYADGPMDRLGHISSAARTAGPFVNLKFSISSQDVIPSRPGALKILELHIPLWLPLLLLLITPVCWLIARPANAPAFAVITNAKR